MDRQFRQIFEEFRHDCFPALPAHPGCIFRRPRLRARLARRRSLDAIADLNKQRLGAVGDPEIATRIASYEMAYKMQITAPEVMNINDEPQYIRDMYGIREGKNSFANNVLLARKLVENGVRFVQLFDWGWDSHGTDPSTRCTGSEVHPCAEELR